MELALSLGKMGVEESNNNNNNISVGFCMGLRINNNHDNNSSSSLGDNEQDKDTIDQAEMREKVGSSPPSPPSPPCLQLDLLPFSPLPRPSHPLPLRFPWLADNMSSEPGSSDGPGARTMDMNRRAAVAVTAEEVEEQSSPNSGTSSFMEFSLYTSTKRRNGNNGNDMMGVGLFGGGDQVGRGATTSRGSDDDDNSGTRKKLRLSKEQSAFLEESFKEHHTLNPKQKLALAKQLNLRPRQVEVWFQNRRARTKLKQTEVDCEYLKRCCETLTEENRRLQKELQELRALKTSQPFFMQLPATTLTMCPSCERVAPTSTSSTATATVTTTTTAVTLAAKHATCPSDNIGVTLSLGKPRPISTQAEVQAHQAAS